MEETVKVNIQRVVEELTKAQPVLAERVKAGTLRIVGGRYDLGTGAVSWLPPAQD